MAETQPSVVYEPPRFSAMHTDSQSMEVTQASNATVKIRSSKTRARLDIVFDTAEQKWLLSYHLAWKGVGTQDGTRYISDAELSRAFDLDPDDTDATSYFHIEGKFMRTFNQLKIPGGAGAGSYDGSPHIDIVLTPEMKRAVRTLLESRAATS